VEKGKERDKQIAIAPALFGEFERMAESYGLTNKGLLEAMMRYFKATKADPREPKADNPTDAIKALDKRLISFIRQQEKDILRPIQDEMKLTGDELYGLKDTVETLDKNLNQRLAKLLLLQLGTAIRPEFLKPEYVEAWHNERINQQRRREQTDAMLRGDKTNPAQPVTPPADGRQS